MGLEHIVERIVAESQAEERSIISGAEAERQKMLSEAGKKRDEILAGYRRRMEEALIQLKQREAARTEVEVKKRLLEVRKEILDDARTAVLEHFGALSEDARRRYYSAMLKQVVAELPSGAIRCRKDEERFFSGIPNFTIGENIECIGGFLAESNDGSVVLDMRFDDIVREIWERNAGEISRTIFPEGEI